MKAIVLVSGGLDSSLCVKIMQNQGIEPVPVNFDIGFSQAKLRKTIPMKKKRTLFGIDALESMGYAVKTVDVGEAFFREVLLFPRFGYGKAVNPCIDCKIFLFRKAFEYAHEIGAKFLVSGEVLDQRPMSQNLNSLKNIERGAGVEGWILRPLSAKLLPETIPEKEGWVNRSTLYSISGRRRTEQIELAKELGIDVFESPAGGCFLTEAEFFSRAKDHFIHYGKNPEDFWDFQLMKVGYHFRLSPQCKLVVGRNQFENEYLTDIAKKLHRPILILDGQSNPGALALLVGDSDDSILELALSIAARYTDKRDSARFRLSDTYGAFIEERQASAIPQPAFENFRISRGISNNIS